MSINQNTDLKEMTVVQLRAIAKEMHICKWYNLNKQPLIDAILSEMKNEDITEFSIKNKCNALVINGLITKKCLNEIDDNESFCCHHKEQYKFDKPNECSICFESLDNKQIPLNCGHWFHKSCIHNTKKHTCPLCRKKLSIKEIKYFELKDSFNLYFENMTQAQRNIMEEQRQQRLREVVPQNRFQIFTSTILGWFGF
jgi:hypothetical protein